MFFAVICFTDQFNRSINLMQIYRQRPAYFALESCMRSVATKLNTSNTCMTPIAFTSKTTRITAHTIYTNKCVYQKQNIN